MPTPLSPPSSLLAPTASSAPTNLAFAARAASCSSTGLASAAAVVASQLALNSSNMTFGPPPSLASPLVRMFRTASSASRTSLFLLAMSFCYSSMIFFVSAKAFYAASTARIFLAS